MTCNRQMTTWDDNSSVTQSDLASRYSLSFPAALSICDPIIPSCSYQPETITGFSKHPRSIISHFPINLCYLSFILLHAVPHSTLKDKTSKILLEKVYFPLCISVRSGIKLCFWATIETPTYPGRMVSGIGPLYYYCIKIFQCYTAVSPQNCQCSSPFPSGLWRDFCWTLIGRWPPPFIPHGRVQMLHWFHFCLR